MRHEYTTETASTQHLLSVDPVVRVDSVVSGLSDERRRFFSQTNRRGGGKDGIAKTNKKKKKNHALEKAARDGSALSISLSDEPGGRVPLAGRESGVIVSGEQKPIVR